MTRPDVAHIIAILRTAMRILGFKNSDIERKLGWSTSYLSRLFSGGIELRFEHVLEISKALGLRPHEIFRFAYPDPAGPPSEAAQRLKTSTGNFHPMAPTAAAAHIGNGATPTEADLERLMAKTLRRFFGEMSRVGEE